MLNWPHERPRTCGPFFCRPGQRRVGARESEIQRQRFEAGILRERIEHALARGIAPPIGRGACTRSSKARTLAVDRATVRRYERSNMPPPQTSGYRLRCGLGHGACLAAHAQGVATGHRVEVFEPCTKLP